ncbi:hypothetical protein AAFF_G00094860 [Aldrovandia affinis]|uniref:Uncharacterized protein n=1 Tax=Aldrovandia affinis TaxID=143900 RepID=A0AAD7RVT7_9TELE|nr:hypothetical protein AAFF_G00094860 [Aldrovandia affinis]
MPRDRVNGSLRGRDDKVRSGHGLVTKRKLKQTHRRVSVSPGARCLRACVWQPSGQDEPQRRSDSRTMRQLLRRGQGSAYGTAQQRLINGGQNVERF